MAIQTEAWDSQIQDQLFQGVEWVRMSTDHSEFINNKTVHLPQSGANPAVTKDRSSYPATIAQRTDSIISYNLSTYDTEPIVITDVDEFQTSYSKRQSVLAQHIDTINERLGLEAAFSWATDTNVIRTSGALASDALAPGATGTRKKLTKDDIRKVAKEMDAQRIPKAGRIGLVDSDMYWQLLEDPTVVSRDYAANLPQAGGEVIELYGIKLMRYHQPVIYAVGGTKKAVGAASAVDDNLAGIFWHPNFVSSAISSIKSFAQEDAPEYFGSIYSAMVFYGAAQLRSSSTGVVAVVQEA